MITELILDEEGLRIALQYYLDAMRSKSESSYFLAPINPKHITRIEIVPQIKRVKVIYEVEQGDGRATKSDTLR